MAHGWNPYLQKYSSFPTDHGTPNSEVNHPHPGSGFIDHDGFSRASIPQTNKQTSAKYCYSNTVGNTNSNWCPEIVENSYEMAWSPGEQKDYLTNWQGSMPNFDTDMPATGGHCSVAPELGPQSLSTGTQFFNNCMSSQGASNERREQSCGFITSTSVNNPQSRATPSQLIQKHPGHASNLIYSNNIWPNRTPENAPKFEDSCKTSDCDDISLTKSIAVVGSFDQTCKQDESVTRPSSENYSSQQTTTQANDSQTESLVNNSSSRLLGKSVTVSCQNREAIHTNKAQDLVSSDVCMTITKDSEIQTSVSSENETTIKMGNSLLSQPVCKVPIATSDARSSEQTDKGPHLHSSTKAGSAELSASFQEGENDCSSLSRISHSVFNVCDTSAQGDLSADKASLTKHNDNDCGGDDIANVEHKASNEGDGLEIKTVEFEQACPAENLSESVICESKIKSTIEFDSGQTSEDSVNIKMEKVTLTDPKNIPIKDELEGVSFPENNVKTLRTKNTDTLICQMEKDPLDDEKSSSCMDSGQITEEMDQTSPFVKSPDILASPCNSVEGSVYADGEPLSPPSSEINQLPELESCEPAKSLNHSKMKSSSEMLRLQPIVLIKTIDEADLTEDKYVCAQCLYMASNMDDLIEHYNINHSRHSFQLCTSCGLYLVHQDPSRKHVCNFSSNSRRGKRKVLFCSNCNLQFLKWNPFIKHMRSHTGKTPYRCENCGLYFSQASSLWRHKRFPKRCRREKPIKPKLTSTSQTGTAKSMFHCYVELYDITKTNICKFCGKIFKSKLKLSKHRYNVHKKPSKIKPTEKPSEKEIEVCSDKKRYKCPLCPQIFNNHLNRNRHLKNCVRVFTTFRNQCRVKGRFKCPLCLATFSQNPNRYRHIHKFCLKNFMSFLGRDTTRPKFNRYSNEMATVLDRLKAEEQQLNGKSSVSSVKNGLPEPKYWCSLCPAVFYHQSGKYRHMKKHKLFELTGRRFRYRNSLSQLKREVPKEMPQTDTVPLNQGDRPYCCLQCGKQFKSNLHLIHHKITHQRRIQCTVCKKILPNIGELIEHRKSHINRGLLQCPDCPQKFIYPAYLLRHLRSHLKSQNELLQQHDANASPFQTLSETEYSCPLCNEAFNDAQLLSNHYMTHPLGEHAVCPFCKRKFIKRIPLLLHMARHVGGFFCKCGKKFSQENGLKLHSKTCASLIQSLVCRYCSRPFSRKMYLKKHYRGHQNNTLIKCLTCNFYFGGSRLHEHQQICEGEKITKKCTSQNSNQPTALKVPSKETNYKCPYCHQTFRYGSLYRRHLSKHKDVEVHACILCGQNFPSLLLCSEHESSCKGFYKSVELTANKKDNLSELKCKFCNKTFTKSQHLRSHILTHNEVKPYRCRVCDSCFSRYDHLKVHLGCCKGKVKMQLRPQICIPKISLDQVGTGWQKNLEPGNGVKGHKWECRICERHFTTQAKHNWHNSMFHSVKRFKCMRCSSLFSTERSLAKHKKYSRCRLISILKSESAKAETQATSVSSETHNRILARVQPISATQNLARIFKCNVCPRTFRTRAHLEVHLYLHTRVPSFGCDCGKTFLRKHHLQRHVQTCLKRTKESSSSGFSCAYCNSRFLLFSQLQEHFLNAHKLEETKDEPLKTTPLQQHLSNIPKFEETSLNKPSPAPKLNIPVDEDLDTVPKLKECPFACNICNKGYWNRTLLRNHLRKCKKHVSDTNHLVEEDGPLRANIEMVLTNSPAEHSPEEEIEEEKEVEDTEQQTTSSTEKKAVVYQCSECDQSFTDGLMLISHLEDHGREDQEKRLNTCWKCGKIFSCQARLEKHMKVHESGMFVCTICSKEFPTKTELDFHKEQYHDPSHPYSCRLCKYRFKKKASLCDHCTKEHPNDIFSCHLCERNYTLRASLVRHMIRNHGEQKDGAEKTLSTQSTSESEDDGNDRDDGSTNDNDDSDSIDSDSAPYFPCHVCGKTFTTSENLEDHQRCHLGEKPFECAKCGQCFFQASQLQQHERKHNSEFQCRVCNRGFVSLFALKKHKHTSGKKRPFRCTKCQICFRNQADLAEHKLSHQSESFPCDICNRVFSSKSSRAEHRKIHLPKSSGIELPDQTTVVADDKSASLTMEPMNEFKYRCGVCCVRFRNPEELSEHGCLAGIERQYSCMDCDKHFLHSSHLKKHLSTHKQSSLSKYVCNHCSNSFSTSHDFLNHLRNHDETLRYGQQGFVCPVCHQCFASPAELVFHFPTHPSETFECKICSTTCVTARKLKEHVCHTKETKCKKCGQSNVGNAHECFQKHVELSHGDEDEIDVTGEDLCCCPFCPMQFSSKSNLLEHQNRQHPKEKSFACEICARTYAKQTYLERHLNKHNQKEPGQSTSQIKFQCAQCHGEFSTAKDLSLHLKLHAAEKEVGEFRCDMCYKSFGQLSLLRQHQESHVGQVVYECTECDKAFAFPHLLEEHQQSHV